MGKFLLALQQLGANPGPLSEDEAEQQNTVGFIFLPLRATNPPRGTYKGSHHREPHKTAKPVMSLLWKGNTLQFG